MSALLSGDKLCRHEDMPFLFQYTRLGWDENKKSYIYYHHCFVRIPQAMQGMAQVNFPNKRLSFERQKLFRNFNHVYKNNSNIY